MVRIDVTFLKVFAAMRRLGLKDEEIRGIGKKVFEYNEQYFFEYIAPYHMFLEDAPNGYAHFILRDGDYGLFNTVVGVDENTGKGILRSRSYPNNNERQADLGQIIDKMLEFIVR